MTIPRPLQDFGADLRYTGRMIRRNPGYALAAMCCLALGTGVTATMFSFVDSMLFRGLPVPASGRVVIIDRSAMGTAACSWKDYLEMRKGLRSLEGLAAYLPKGTFLDVDRMNAAIYVEAVSANYADVLHLGTQLGTWFQPGDDSPAAEPALVISDQLWEKQFGRDPQVVGRAVRVEAQRYRIIGVAPRDFRGTAVPLAVDGWVPLATYPHYRPALLSDGRAEGPPVLLVGRLAPRQTAREAQAEFAVADARLKREDRSGQRYPAPLHVAPAAGFNWIGTNRVVLPTSSLLMGVSAIVLLIACVNVASLLLSRAAVRQREMALRQSLGAGRGRLLRQAFAEGLTLSAGSAALGGISGYWMNRLINLWLPSIPKGFDLHLELNWRVALFIAGIAAASAILFSLPPALQNIGRDLTPALKGEGGEIGRHGKRKRDVYALAEVALSLVLLIVAGLMLRALQHAQQIDVGHATDHRLSVRLFTPEADFTRAASSQLFGRLLADARALPGVREATLSFALFGFTDSDCVAADAAATPRRASLNVVEPNYFEMMRVPLARGRNFTEADTAEAPRVMIVNETMARKWWPGQDAIGKTVWLGCGCAPWLPCAGAGARVRAEVIGIARDGKYVTLDEDPRPFYYLSRRQENWTGYFALIVRTEGDPHALAPALFKVARSGGENLRVSDMRSLDDQMELSLWQVRWQAAVLGSFGLLALLLAAVGLYGVVAYAVAQRTREIGLRMALGASARDVERMVLGHGLRIVMAGVTGGLLGSALITRFLRVFLFGVSPLDPVAFGGASAAWIVIAMLASWLPARRATRIDPLAALKHE